MSKLTAGAIVLAVLGAYHLTADAKPVKLEHCWESKSEPKVRHFFNHPCNFKGHVGGSVTVIDDKGYIIKGCSIYSPTQRVFIVNFPMYEITTFMGIDDFDYSMECIWRDDY